MKSIRITSFVAAAGLFATSAVAQHAQVSSVAVHPGNPNHVWVCNRDNGTVSRIDVATSSIVAEIPVGVDPRSVAISHDGTRVFVANQRGDIPHATNFVSGFTGSELRGSISVISTASNTVTTTLSNVGVEPYGLAVAPNGKYFAVTGFRSATVKFYDVVSLSQVASFQYLRDMNVIPNPFTIADVDANRDGVPDLGDPRGFVIRSDSQRMYVTHHKSPYVSALDIALDGNGLPTAVTQAAKINTDEYPFDPIFNPVPVQTIASQGKPRFLEDVSLSPDGTRALVPHVLHNVNHDVNHDFGPGFPGAFANRVYPALTMLDTVTNSYAQLGDSSNRLHNELSDSNTPAAYVPFGRAKRTSAGNIITIGGTGVPAPGSTATFVVDGMQPGDTGIVFVGRMKINQVVGSAGTQLVQPRFAIPMTGNTATFSIGNSPTLNGVVFIAQALITSATNEQTFSTGLRVRINPTGYGMNKMGHRAGHPSRVVYNATGDRALMLNRGSEDVFLYKLAGSDMELMDVFPPRLNFAPRPALDTTTPMGDLPLGMAITPDVSTPNNDDALLFVANEVTRTLSVLRVDWLTGTIHLAKNQIPTHTGPDALTQSQRLGEEIFEDASRPQTTGNFNNSCASCHFEGGEDSNVWQRGDGPRSTMPVYGGTLGTGLGLWKGIRINLGETGPMFGGENGGTGIFTDAEQQALTDYHEDVPFPLNPNLDPVTGQYSATAALGKDLYFGTNDTGLNPTGRHAGCATCHPDVETNPGNFPGPRLYTFDFLNPMLTSGENLATFDPSCFSLRENIVAPNVRNVNTGVNTDADNDTIPDPDRNLDGYNDLETYAVMNSDKRSDFQRDDPNSYPCPCDAQEPNCDQGTLKRIFGRGEQMFSIPQKLGAFSTGPYFHDHVIFSLRHLVDPESQSLSPVYGSPAYAPQQPYPGVLKLFNEFHDVRGHEQFVAGASKVQLNLQSGANVNQDIEALLAYISSL